MNCPDCGADLYPNARRCSCGWKAAGAVVPINPDRYRCENYDRGQRCSRLGTITPNTHGPADGKGPHPGPWYCAQHMPGLNSPRVDAPQGSFEAPRLLTHLVTPVPKPLDAEEILERSAIQADSNVIPLR